MDQGSHFPNNRSIAKGQPGKGRDRLGVKGSRDE
jgi:hypothetical protein